MKDFGSGTVTLDSPTTMIRLKPGWGFYFSNKAELLDTTGEFFYNTAQQKLYVYASAQPANGKVEATVYDYGIYLQAAAYVTVNGIGFLYQKAGGISSTDNNTNVTITNCQFSKIYGRAISMNDVNNAVIMNNQIQDIYSKGMVVNNSDTVTIQNNVVKRIGMYAGRATEKTAQQISYSGMEVEGTIKKGTISLNTLDSIGYNGIRFSVWMILQSLITRSGRD